MNSEAVPEKASPYLQGKGIRSLLLGLAVSSLFLFLTLKKVRWDEVGDAMMGVSLPVLSLALITRGLAFLAMGFRSAATTAPGGIIPFRDLVRAHLFGYTGNNLLPFRLGEVLKVEFLARRHEFTRSFLWGTVALERLLDSLALLGMFGLVVPSVLGRQAVVGRFIPVAIVAVALFVAAMVGARWDRLPEILGGYLERVSSRAGRFGREHSRQVLAGLRSIADLRWAPGATGGTLLYWLFLLGSVEVVILAFGLDLPFYAPAFIVAVTALGTALPSSPGFIGTYHFFSALGLSLLGIDRATSVSFAVVAHAMAFLPYTILGLVLFSGSILSMANRTNPGRESGRSNSVSS